jgi:hypothetical protein
VKGKITYEFHAKLWQHNGPSGWYFVSLPINIASEIRENLKWQEEGWGRMKATAKIGQSQWETAIWFDTKHNTYILPIKGEIRKKERLGSNEAVQVIIGV